MRMTYTAVAMTALLCASTGGTLRADPPDVPKDLKAEPGQITEVVVKLAAGDDLGYKLASDKALFRELKADSPRERVFWFQAAEPGVYAVVFWTKGEATGTLCTITVGKPKPPEPPAPPPGPQPSAELVKKVSDAFAKDKGRATDAAQLAALYREAAKLTAKKKGDGYECPTTRELLRRVREASTGLIGDDVLVSVRTVAAGELAMVAGMSSDDPLTEAQRQGVADTYVRLAVCLDVLAK